MRSIQHVGLLIIGSGIVGCDSISDLLIERMCNSELFINAIVTIAGNLITGFVQ
jgi:hypothetical protein